MPAPAAAAAEPMRPVLPKLSAAQVTNLDKQRELYRREVADRVHRGEITAAAAKNLVDAREWQVAEQLWGLAPVDSGASPGAADAAPPQWDRPYLYQGFAYDFHTLFPYFFLPSPACGDPGRIAGARRSAPADGAAVRDWASAVRASAFRPLSARFTPVVRRRPPAPAPGPRGGIRDQRLYCSPGRACLRLCLSCSGASRALTVGLRPDSRTLHLDRPSGASTIA